MRYFYAWLVAVADMGLMSTFGYWFCSYFVDKEYGFPAWMVFAVGVLLPIGIAGVVIIAHILG
jgi:hypothetical protein